MQTGEPPSTGTPLLRTEGLTKRYRGLVALKDHAISIRSGEIVGVIGPNGSGKSTFFNLVTGFSRPNAGRDRVPGPIDRRTVNREYRGQRHRPHFPGVSAVHLAHGARQRPRGRAAAPPDRPACCDHRGPRFHRHAAAMTEMADDLLHLLGLHAQAGQPAADAALWRPAPARDRPGAGDRAAIAFAGRASGGPRLRTKRGPIGGPHPHHPRPL